MNRRGLVFGAHGLGAAQCKVQADMSPMSPLHRGNATLLCCAIVCLSLSWASQN